MLCRKTVMRRNRLKINEGEWPTIHAVLISYDLRRSGWGCDIVYAAIKVAGHRNPRVKVLAVVDAANQAGLTILILVAVSLSEAAQARRTTAKFPGGRGGAASQIRFPSVLERPTLPDRIQLSPVSPSHLGDNVWRTSTMFSDLLSPLSATASLCLPLSNPPLNLDVLYGWSLVGAIVGKTAYAFRVKERLMALIAFPATAPIWPVAPLTESAAAPVGQQGGSAEDEEEGEIEPHLEGDVFEGDMSLGYGKTGPVWIWRIKLTEAWGPSAELIIEYCESDICECFFLFSIRMRPTTLRPDFFFGQQHLLCRYALRMNLY